MKLAVWSPLPPSPSGIADYVAEGLPTLARAAEVCAVVEEPPAVEETLRGVVPVVRPGEEGKPDLDVYHLGNSPAHAYVYGACLRRPGAVVLHEWSLHHLVLSETVERGRSADYLRQMRRAYGERGSFVGRQVARALGGDLLPALFPLNERVIQGSLAVVALTERVRALAAAAMRGRPAIKLPHHAFLPPGALCTRDEARRRLGLPLDAAVVVAPGLATAAKRLEPIVRIMARLRRRLPSVTLVVAGGVDPGLPLTRWTADLGLEACVRVTGRLALDDFVRYLCAADAVSCLRFPSHGEISGALLRTLAVGRPALVTAGTPAAEEFPEGVVVPIDPGPYEEAELEATLARVLEDRPLADRIGALARRHVARHHDLASTAEHLVTFLQEVAADKAALLGRLEASRASAGGLAGRLLDEVTRAARELGLGNAPSDVPDLLVELAGGAR